MTNQNSKSLAFNQVLKQQDHIFQNAMAGLNEKQALQRPSDNTNHINWLLGHILHCRYMLANMLGEAVENPFGKTYFSPITNGDYPTVHQIAELWPAVTEKLTQKIAAFTEAGLDERSNPEGPAPSDLIAFFIYHEGYHLGQIGFIRKLLGFEPMKTN